MLTIIPKNKKNQNISFKTSYIDNDNYMKIKDYEQTKPGLEKEIIIDSENNIND